MDRAASPRRSAHPQRLRRLESPRRHRTARRAPGDLALVPHRRVGEIDTSALFDVYSYASAAHLIPVSTGSSITTAHGVVLLTTPAAAFRQRASRLVLPGAHSDSDMTPALRTLAARQGLPVTPLGQGNTSGFDAALADLASSSGTAISRSTTKMMDYPTRPAAQNTASPAVRAPLLFALAIILAAAVGMTPTLTRVLHRRHRDRQTT